MPLPSPKNKEKEQEFVSRCMGDTTMNKEYPDQKQRAAICYSQYKRAKKKNEAEGSTEEPNWSDHDMGGGIVLF
jgi:hypothetical protein